ncbi:MAG: ankyrin repeat domain-containing protein [Rickettsiales bacterium]
MALSLDNAQLEKNTRQRLNAIIQDINDGRLPESRYHEVLNENYFEDDTEICLGVNSQTFIAYAINKLKDPKQFLEALKYQLGGKLFNEYMNLPNFLQCGEELKSFNAYELYLQDKGQGHNLAKLPDDLMALLRNNRPGAIQQILTVNAHDNSAHKSADEAHILAFNAMLQATPLLVDVAVVYQLPAIASRKVVYTSIDELTVFGYRLKINGSAVNIIVKYISGMDDACIAIDNITALEQFIANYRANNEWGSLNVECDAPESSRVVTVTRNNNLTGFVNAQLRELQAKIDQLVGINDEAINNTYLKDNPMVKTKVDGLRFQANAAKRYVDDMINNHKCGGQRLSYDTNIINTCGLTMEEMIATAYFSSKERMNFLGNATPDGNFIGLVKQLHDMRRGYNIDSGEDKPDVNQYPKNPGQDNNRCAGGGINSLSWALKSCHSAYNPVIITRGDAEKALREIYYKIITDNMDGISEKITSQELNDWAVRKKITGELRQFLTAIFRATYETDFRNCYAGYIRNNLLNQLINNCLDNIEAPQELKEIVAAKLFENLTVEQICSAIRDNTVELMHLDENNGYESTLNYLARKKGDGFVCNIVQIALNEKPLNKSAILFLSKSNLPDSLKNNVIHKIGDSSFTLEDIRPLNQFELTRLLDSTTIEDLMSRNFFRRRNLLMLCLVKVEFTPVQLATEYYDGIRTTHLGRAAYHGEVGAVNSILKMPGINKVEVLTKKDSTKGNTPLHLAVFKGHVAVVEAILAAEGVDKEALLNAKDNNGVTPLHGAAFNGHVHVVNAILAAEGVDKEALLDMNNNNDFTPLHLAAQEGHVAVVEAILAAEVGDKQALLDMKNNNGVTPLHLAVFKGHTNVVNAILAAEGVDKEALLNAKDNNGATPLHLAVKNGKSDIIAALLMHGAYPSIDILLTKNGLSEDNNNKLLGAYLKSPLKTDEGVQKIRLQAESEKNASRINYLNENGAREILVNVIKSPALSIAQNALSSTTMPENPPSSPIVTNADIAAPLSRKRSKELEEGEGSTKKYKCSRDV